MLTSTKAGCGLRASAQPVSVHDSVNTLHKFSRPDREVAAGRAKRLSHNSEKRHRECKANAGAAAEQQAQGPSPLVQLLTVHGARLTSAAQMAWAQVLRPGDTAVDATCGNGNDTLALARAVGPTGTVHGMDLQAVAVERTEQLLTSSLGPSQLPALHLLQGCHSELLQQLPPSSARLVCFNLGYLPKGDKAVITQAPTTAAAVNASLQVVQEGGLVSVMAYIGHPGGVEEYQTVKQILQGLPPGAWATAEVSLLNRSGAPILLLAWRVPMQGD